MAVHPLPNLSRLHKQRMFKHSPTRHISPIKRNIAGTFESFEIDALQFESQLRHFRKHGHAADPFHSHRITGLVSQHEENEKEKDDEQQGSEGKRTRITDVTSEDWMGPWTKTDNHTPPPVHPPPHMPPICITSPRLPVSRCR